MRRFVSALDAIATAWAECTDRVVSACSVAKGGAARRAAKDVGREIGHDVLAAEAVRRGYHGVQSGDEF